MAPNDLDLIGWPGDAPLSIPPVSISARRAALKFPVTLTSKAALPQKAGVSVVRVERVGSDTPASFVASAAPVVLQRSGDTATGNVSLRLERNMPPGKYMASVEIGGLAREISFDVVEEVSLRVRPSPILIDAAAAGKTEAMISFENKGNVPVLLDLAGTYPLGREEPLAPGVPEAENGFGVLTAALSRAPRVLTEVGAVTVAMKSGAVTLAPGATASVSFTSTWDTTLEPARRYRAFVPVYTADVEIVIVTATKPTATKSTAAKSTPTKSTARKSVAAATGTKKRR